MGIVGLPGCAAISELRFTNDHRLTVLSPTAGSTVRIPFTVRWRVSDFRPVRPHLDDPSAASAPSRGAGYFALFVDSTPMAPGESFDAVVRGDTACVASPTCPDAAYLAGQDVYVTSATSFTVPTVLAASEGASATDVHEVSIVLVDSRGRRIGDSSWNVSFAVKGS